MTEGRQDGLAHIERPQPPAVAMCPVDADELLHAFLSGRSGQTVRAYTSDLADFAAFLGTESVSGVTRELFGAGHGRANLLAFRYKAHLVDERGLAGTTVNRKLASLRSLVALGNTMGMIDWQLQVPNQKIEKYGNISGVGVQGIKRLLRKAGNQRGVKAVRDTAIVRAFYDLALRRSEVCALDLADVDLENKTLLVLGKGHTQKTAMSFPDATRDTLSNWIEARGTEPGALFYSLDHRFVGQKRRLTSRGIYEVIRTLGKKTGMRRLHPHQLRHTSITEAVKSSVDCGISLDEVMQFSRHKDVSTMLIYRDKERNVQGQLAAQVASKL